MATQERQKITGQSNKSAIGHPVRLIPRLDIKGPNLVKGIHLEGLRVLGKPQSFARHYYETGADELFYMDAVASLYGRNSLLDIVSRTAKEIFIPLTVGGGLRTIEDVRSVLSAGADKVAINTAAVRRPEFVKEAAQKFGSSTVVVAVDAIEVSKGSYKVFVDYGREETGIDVFEWCKRAVDLGAGELMITSVNRDGTGKGFDCALVKRIAENVPVPVIACGGAGTKSHVAEVVLDGKADAVSVASILHYGCVQQLTTLDEKEFAEEGNLEFLRQQRMYSKVEPTSIPEIKAHMRDRNLECRN